MKPALPEKLCQPDHSFLPQSWQGLDALANCLILCAEICVNA